MAEKSFLERLLGRLGGKGAAGPQTEPDAPLKAEDLLQRRVDQEDALRDARAAGRPFALLRPAVPIVAGRDYPGWIGGAPDLPDGAVWPQVDDVPLHFLVQIDCSVLPDDIWHGQGPRSGWLRLFARDYWDDGPGDFVLGLWSEERGTRRTAPAIDLANAEWLDRAHLQHPDRAGLTPWPLEIRLGTDTAEANADRYQTGAQAFYAMAALDLSDDSLRPFDPASLGTLIDLLRQDLNRLAAFPDQWRSGQPAMPAEDAQFLEDYRRRVASALEAFEAAADRVETALTAAAPAGPAFAAVVDELVSALGAIEVPWARKQNEGKPFETVSVPLTVAPPPGFPSTWPQQYRSALYGHAKTAYSADPDRLPDPQRTFFEAIWAEDAVLSSITMGAVPRGYYEIDHVDGEPEEEVLIEFNSSKLIGWIWADVATLIVTLSPEDLANGRFDRLAADFTN